MYILSIKKNDQDFKQKQLCRNLNNVMPNIRNVTHITVYFIETTHGHIDLAKLKTVIPYEKKIDATDIKQVHCWITPKAGITTAWSSKTKDILKHAGINNIQHIEQGTLIIFASDEDQMIYDNIKIYSHMLHDKMTEQLITESSDLQHLFDYQKPQPLKSISYKDKSKLVDFNDKEHIGLSKDLIEYAFNYFSQLQRNATDCELMMIAQMHSEHCRHHIFNSQWTIDDITQPDSLFDMIKSTYQANGQHIKVAYKDNAAVIDSCSYSDYWYIDSQQQNYKSITAAYHAVLKVETHNHPTAIAPHPGAATGSGGEIRDETATGRGAKPIAGLAGFMVSDLHLPQQKQQWELNISTPQHISSALNIMIEGPLGAASYNNEFGRPQLCGFFRSFSQNQDSKLNYGYHKPVMLAGGIGQIQAANIYKDTIQDGDLLIVLGGPSYAIGLGGGAASSQHNQKHNQNLDFASVQRANPEMQRRAQQVINSFADNHQTNPIISIHDVGAGGLSNALPELCHDSNCGGFIHLRDIPVDDPSLSAKDIWCNESQERYVIAINPNDLHLLKKTCKRERCPFAVVGHATKHKQLTVYDAQSNCNVIDLPMNFLFDALPRQKISVQTIQDKKPTYHHNHCRLPNDLDHMITQLLNMPTIADKSFLITIGDRSVGGLTTRDQMVGPWQIPVADVAVSMHDFHQQSGQAMAVGERSPVAIHNPGTSVQLALGEALTNIAAAGIQSTSAITLSANWMAACSLDSEKIKLYDAVKSLSRWAADCGLCIPVGKDSLSMQASWHDESGQTNVIAPVTAVITATATIDNIRHVTTPMLSTQPDTTMYLIDLAEFSTGLAGSCLSQAFSLTCHELPDICQAQTIKDFISCINKLIKNDLLLAYHDRSDGGLITTCLEMAFAARCGIDINISNNLKQRYSIATTTDLIKYLCSEGLGTIIQIHNNHTDQMMEILRQHALDKYIIDIGKPNASDTITITQDNHTVYQQDRCILQREWSKTSFHISSLRDNPKTAAQAYDNILKKDVGLNCSLTPSAEESIATINKKQQIDNSAFKPYVAILREQGSNGHYEMAAAFAAVGFQCIDITMSDLINDPKVLEKCQGLALCGGFSYGDVLGAGRGWAQIIRHHNNVHKALKQFWHAPHTFTLGICNGCQVLSQLTDLMPGTTHFPKFDMNESRVFEARLSLVRINHSPSIFLKPLENCVLPVVVSHMEGRVQSADATKIAMQYVSHDQHPTELYPYNPNGSMSGACCFSSDDGRITIMMPHPERIFKTSQMSWHPKNWGEYSPWLCCFKNLYTWAKFKNSTKVILETASS